MRQHAPFATESVVNIAHLSDGRDDGDGKAISPKRPPSKPPSHRQVALLFRALFKNKKGLDTHTVEGSGGYTLLIESSRSISGFSCKTAFNSEL